MPAIDSHADVIHPLDDPDSKFADAVVMPFKGAVADQLAGRTVGHETHTFGDGGSVRVNYSYNDRGRGSDIQGRYVFDRDGMPVVIELTGQDYNHAAIDERFTKRDGATQWRSRAESDESKTGGWYVAANGPPAQTAWLAQAMLRSRKPSMHLLPAGEATLERGPSVELKGRRVTMYSVGGLDFTPFGRGEKGR